MSMVSAPPRTVPVDQTLRVHLALGLMAFVLLFLVIGTLAAMTDFAGAVVAQGQIVVDSSVKKVQHQTGGTVSALAVKDGDRVEAGAVLLRLDETMTRANLAIVAKGLDENVARLARLRAERDGASDLDLDGAASGLVIDLPPGTIEGERRLLGLRRDAREGQKSQLSERVNQLQQEIAGLEQQVRAKAGEIDLISDELKGVRDLYKRKLVSIQRVSQLSRDAVRLEGERGQLLAAMAQARGKITETQMQIIQVDQDLRSEVAKDMREVEAKIAELVERKAAALDQLQHTELRAPQAGIVHQLAVHTIGGVVSPGEPVMLIVPEADRLVVEVKIAPNDIDRLHPRQTAALRLTAFDMRTTPEIRGEVERVAPDLTTDQRTGQAYYTIRVAIPREELAKIDGARIVPGMPVEAFLETESRTVLSYLTKPLWDQVRRVFRDR